MIICLNRVRALLLSALLLVALPFGFSGCVAVLAGSAGAGAATYMAGSLKSTLDQGIDRVWAASRAATSDLRFTVESENQDATVGEIKAKNAAGSQIFISLKAETPTQTSVSIRVGLLGDQDASIIIFDKIKANL